MTTSEADRHTQNNNSKDTAMGELVNSLIDHVKNDQQLCEVIQAEDLALKLVKAT